MKTDTTKNYLKQQRANNGRFTSKNNNSNVSTVNKPNNPPSLSSLSMTVPDKGIQLPMANNLSGVANSLAVNSASFLSTLTNAVTATTRQAVTDTQLAAMVGAGVEQFINEGDEFTAYDLTTKIRESNSNLEIVHNDVKRILSDLIDSKIFILDRKFSNKYNAYLYS